MRERGGASNVGLACRRVTAFFYYGDDGRGTEPQHAGGFADPAAVERQVVDLAADFRYLASILVLEKKAPPRAPVVVTPIALGPVGGLPALITSVL